MTPFEVALVVILLAVILLALRGPRVRSVGLAPGVVIVSQPPRLPGARRRVCAPDCDDCRLGNHGRVPEARR